MIAPACDGQDVGESWLAHQWATRLAERVDLTVLTTYKRGHTPPSRQLPGVCVVEWSEPRASADSSALTVCSNLRMARSTCERGAGLGPGLPPGRGSRWHTR